MHPEVGADGLCQLLEWDSAFFGQRIGRVLPERLTPETVGAALEWAAANRVDCLYFLADAGDAPTVRLAEDHGFRFVDARLLFERAIGGGGALPERVRLSVADDIPALRAIARGGHRDTRFYYDGRFPVERCDALYETWIENSCRGYADAVLVSGPPGQPDGYISCHLDPDAGRIGLVGVSAAAQGQGLGRDLVNGALAWFGAQGMSAVTVVTQARNVRAQRLYQRAGFLTRSVAWWYHRWSG